MTLNRINPLPHLTAQLVAQRTFTERPFCVLDVGASLGIEAHWRIFDDQLMAFGFDPLIQECKRLNRAETLVGVHYIPRWIRDNTYLARYNLYEHFTAKTVWPYSRTTMASAANILSFEASVLYSAGNTNTVTTNDASSIDDFVTAERLDSVDFIKIDTDGSDFEALLSAEQTLAKRGVLGIRIESLFHGPTHPLSNTWANIDRFMRENGYSLFDFDRFRLSRAALPDAFVFPAPSATFRGQVAWVDALYFRDTGHPEYFTQWGVLSPMKLLKLACAFEIYGLHDCAADVIVRHREVLAAFMDVDKALDVLAEDWLPGCGGFTALQSAFESDPTRFYPDGDVGLSFVPRSYDT